MPAMEAIYLIGPSESSVRGLLQDFTSQNRTTYKAAHVYFTEGEKLDRFRKLLIILTHPSIFQFVLRIDSKRSATLSLPKGSRP